LVQWSDAVVPYVAPQTVWQQLGSALPFLGLSVVGAGALLKAASVIKDTLVGPPSPKADTATADTHELGHSSVVLEGEAPDAALDRLMDKQMQSMLAPDTFRYCVGGVDKDNQDQAYAVTYTRGKLDFFEPIQAEQAILDQAIDQDFKVKRVQVSWHNKADLAERLMPASYYAGLNGLLNALRSMPDKRIKVSECHDKYFFRGLCDAVCIYAGQPESSLAIMNRYVSNFREFNSQFEHEPNRTEQYTRLAKIKTYQASAKAQEADLGGDNPSDLNIKGNEPKSNL